MTLTNRTIIIEEDAIRVRFEHFGDDSDWWRGSYWDIDEDRWEPVIRSEPFTSKEILWYCATALVGHEIYQYDLE